MGLRCHSQTAPSGYRYRQHYSGFTACSYLSCPNRRVIPLISLSACQPTSPLRSAEDIDQVVNLCLGAGADSAVSLCQAKNHPFWMKKIVDGRVHPLIEGDEQRFTRRQDLPPVYQLNGALYVSRIKVLLEENRMLQRNILFPISCHRRDLSISIPRLT